MRCAEHVAVTLRCVASVPGVPFDLCALNVIQEENVITFGEIRTHMLEERACVREGKFGNCIEAIRVARHHNPPRTCCSGVEAW